MDVPAEPIQEQVPDIPAIEPINEPLLPEQPKVESDASASVGASIINMTNNVLGSGLVALAYAVSEVRPGCPRSSLVFPCSWYCSFDIVGSNRMCVTDCDYSELPDYGEVYLQGDGFGRDCWFLMTQQIFGKTGGIIISFIMLLYTCGSCISYFVIIGRCVCHCVTARRSFHRRFHVLLPEYSLPAQPRYRRWYDLPCLRVPSVHDEEYS